MSNKLKKGGGTGGDARAPTSPTKALFKSTGTMIMKSVSIFLASGRRASSNRASQSESVTGNKNDKRRKNKNSNKMEDASGKINPKLLETFKKKTHFNKYDNISINICKLYELS